MHCRESRGAEETPALISEAPRLLDPLFTTNCMRDIFSDRSTLQCMLEFEAALARALAREKIAPWSVAIAIQRSCKADLFSLENLAIDAAGAGNLAIPMVRSLAALAAKRDPKAGDFVHWGATSQDAIDTGRVLQIREALGDFDECLSELAEALAELTERHLSVPLPGRTWLQQGPPVTVGFKAAGWLDAIERHRTRFQEMKLRVLCVQFGGAVGTLAALGNSGPKVAAALARELKLSLPAMPWHSHRDRVAEVATAVGLLTGTLGKIARDISLLAQTEIAEMQEKENGGKGGSSTMPHKRNPVDCAVVLAAAVRVPSLVATMLSSMIQENERGIGGWQAEWETLPEICLIGAGALARLAEVIKGLEIHAAKMDENLGVSRGLILAEAVSFALARRIGKPAAHKMLERASRQAVAEKRSLQSVLIDDMKIRTYLSEAEIAYLLDPRNYLGSAVHMARKVLSDYRKRKSGPKE